MTFMGKDITNYKPYMSARTGLARTFQVVQPFPAMTVFENVLAGALFGSAGGTYDEAAELTTKEPGFCWPFRIYRCSSVGFDPSK